jgi:hypothetical protein
MALQIRRTKLGGPPEGLAEGQLAVELGSAPPRLWVGCDTDTDPSGRLLLNVPGDEAGAQQSIGTFTPRLNVPQAMQDSVFTVAGFYHRIGQRVEASIRVDFTSVGGGTPGNPYMYFDQFPWTFIKIFPLRAQIIRLNNLISDQFLAGCFGDVNWSGFTPSLDTTTNWFYYMNGPWPGRLDESSPTPPPAGWAQAGGAFLINFRTIVGISGASPENGDGQWPWP